MAVNYLQAVDAAIVLDYRGTDHAVVKGLNKLSLPGMTRSVVTVDEFRNEWARKFAGGGEYTDITFGGNFVTGDTKGQDQLKQHWVDKTKLTGTDILFFLNLTDFFATDLANDTEAGFQIVEMGGSEADKNSIYAMTGKAVANGRIAIYNVHKTDVATPTMAFVDGGAGEDTITDSGNGFVTAGFVAGQSLMVVNSTSNDGCYLIKTVAAGTITLTSIGVLNSEAAIEGTELHGGLL